MHRVMMTCIAMLVGQALAAQTAVKTIEDGALDRIELFLGSPDLAATPGVVIRLFDASSADLGTGAKGGKDDKPPAVAAVAPAAACSWSRSSW